jgi:hypothetical protein
VEPPLLDLLDDRRLDGELDVSCLLGPVLSAALLDRADFAGALRAIETLCQQWGGVCSRLYAITRGAAALPEELSSDFRHGDVHDVGGAELLSDAFDRDGRKDVLLTDGYTVGSTLLSALLPSGQIKDVRLRVAEIDPDDPWCLSYMAALGTLKSEEFTRHEAQSHNLKLGVSWADLIDVERDEVLPGGLDLLNRVRDRGRLTPARLSRLLLDLWIVGRDQGMDAGESPLRDPTRVKRMVGPNVVVVYEPGSVSDLALLWNLRAAHGLPLGFPLGVPVSVDVRSVLEEWRTQHAMSYFGLGGDRGPRLVSTSVDAPTLEGIASRVMGYVVGGVDEFRDVGRRPGRHSLRVVRFQDGAARIASWSDQDRIELGTPAPYGRQPNLRFSVAPTTRRLPPSLSLRPDWSFEPGCREWGYQADDHGPGSLLNVRWPAGWTVVQKLLADRGLRGEPSLPGRAGAAMLRRLGSHQGLAMVLDPSILGLLDQLGTAKSMSWVKRRVRAMAARAAELSDEHTPLDAVERALAELTLRPSDEEQPQVTVEAVRKVVDNKRDAARTWIRWAEDAGVIVRGAGVKCDCGADSWRHMGELAPPVICRGCGATIAYPYPEGELKFQYRASEPLLRLVEHDAMPHLLAMRFFCQLWHPSFDRPSQLFGAYPGVDIYEERSKVRIAEADVLLVLTNGELVPGECKRRGAGLNSTEVTKLEQLADRLESPWSFFATVDWADDCQAIWEQSIRFAPDPSPRVVLTAEHLLNEIVFWQAGTNIFEWSPATEEERAKRHREFVAGLSMREQIALERDD